MTKTLFILLFVCYTLRPMAQTTVNFTVTIPAVLVADAGPDSAVYTGSRILIGGSPAVSGGSLPYNFLWMPSIGISDISIANPWAFPTKSTSYTFLVTDNNGCTATDHILVKSKLTGINPNEEKMTFSIYPNPNHGLFNVVLDGNYRDFTLTITVTNLVGEEIYNDLIFKVTGKIEKTIDLTGYSRGIYIVRLTGENTNLVKKLMVE